MRSSDQPGRDQLLLEGVAQRKISINDQQSMLEPLGLTREYSRVLQWLVLSRDSLQRIQGLLSHPIQRTQSITLLPTSLIGQAQQPPGGYTSCCSLPCCNFQRVAHASLYCKRYREVYPAGPYLPRCNFPRIATIGPERKLLPCGKQAKLWETRLKLPLDHS